MKLRYVVVDGKRTSLAERARHLGISRQSLSKRLKTWVDKEAALRAGPIVSLGRPENPRSLRQRARRAGISYQLVWARVNVLGWSEERALATPARRCVRRRTSCRPSR